MSTQPVSHSEASPVNGTTSVVPFIALAVCLIIGPSLIYPVFLMKALCFALFACAFNILLGFTGLLSFGHAAFLGMASYSSAHAAKLWGLTPELAIAFGTLVAMALGAVIGMLTIRSRGIYFANITLAFAQMVFFFCLQAKFTGGEDGIQSVPRGSLFGLISLKSDMAMYVFVAVVFFVAFVMIHRIIHSPFGQVLRAVRENEARAISLGYKAEQYKLAAFILSATLAGLAGSIKALVFQLASLTDVTWQMSGEVVLMTLLGGVGTIFGPAVGAFVIVSMENYLAELGSWVLVVQGAIFVLCVMTFRRGIVGTASYYWNKRQQG